MNAIPCGPSARQQRNDLDDSPGRARGDDDQAQRRDQPSSWTTCSTCQDRSGQDAPGYSSNPLTEVLQRRSRPYSRPRRPNADLHLSVDPPPRRSRIPDRLQHIANLLSNAISSRRRGRVRLETPRIRTASNHRGDDGPHSSDLLPSSSTVFVRRTARPRAGTAASARARHRCDIARTARRQRVSESPRRLPRRDVHDPFPPAPPLLTRRLCRSGNLDTAPRRDAGADNVRVLLVDDDRSARSVYPLGSSGADGSRPNRLPIGSRRSAALADLIIATSHAGETASFIEKARGILEARASSRRRLR